MTQPAIASRRDHFAFVLCVAIIALMVVDLTKPEGEFSTAPGLRTDNSSIKWVVWAYAATFALTLLPAGWLGDHIEHRPVLLSGLALFLCASGVCFFGSSPGELAIGRGLEGAAAGIVVPQVLGLMQRVRTGPERTRAFAVVGGVVFVSTAIGPPIGDGLLALGGPANGRNLLFGVDIPLVVLLGVGVRAFMPHVHMRRTLRRATRSRDSRAPLRESPLLLLRVLTQLLRVRSYRSGVIIGALCFVTLPGLVLIPALPIGHGAPLEPAQTAAMSVVFALSAAVFTWLGARLVLPVGPRVVVVGLAVLAVGCGLTTLAVAYVPGAVLPPAIGSALLLAGAGAGLCLATNHALTLADIEVGKIATAGAMAQLGQRVGTAIGLTGGSGLVASLAATPPHVDRAALERAFMDYAGVALLALVLAGAVAVLEIRAASPG